MTDKLVSTPSLATASAPLAFFHIMSTAPTTPECCEFGPRVERMRSKSPTQTELERLPSKPPTEDKKQTKASKYKSDESYATSVSIASKTSRSPTTKRMARYDSESVGERFLEAPVESISEVSIGSPLQPITSMSLEESIVECTDAKDAKERDQHRSVERDQHRSVTPDQSSRTTPKSPTVETNHHPPEVTCSFPMSPLSSIGDKNLLFDELKEINAKLDELKAMLKPKRPPHVLLRSPTQSKLVDIASKPNLREQFKTMRSQTLNSIPSHHSEASIATVQTFRSILGKPPGRNSISRIQTSDNLDRRADSPNPFANSQSIGSGLRMDEHNQNSMASVSTRSIRDKIKAASGHLRSLAVEHSVRKRVSANLFGSWKGQVEVSYILAEIWNLLEEPESSRCAHYLSALMPWFITATVLITLLQSAPSLNFNGVQAAIYETSIDSLFLLEFLLRFACCPHHYSFVFNVYNYIDLAAAIPIIPRACAGFVLSDFDINDASTCFLFCVVPMIRMLKLLRRFEKFHLLLNAFKLAFEALPVLFFILAAIALFFSMIIFLVEKEMEGTKISSWPLSAWLTIVTMSTVGYGDYTPKTSAGIIVSSVLIIVTVLYMAIPLGIVGNAFTETWKDRDRILLMQRTRDRLKQWGYTAHDIPTLFHLSDDDGDSKLTLAEFSRLIKQMQLGFSDARILQLFNLFDQDGNGTVDDAEFVHTLFPNSYHEIYQNYWSQSASYQKEDSQQG